MNDLNVSLLRTPYLIFVGDEGRPSYAKTGAGLAHWRRSLCAGQLRLPGGTDLGLPDMSIDEAADAGVSSLIVGTSLVGGALQPDWIDLFADAARKGIDIVAGLHSPLSDSSVLVDAARDGGARLIDVRVPPRDIPVASGRKRSGRRLLTVGTDCAIGKKFTALQLEQDMHAAGMKATFRATGQTGIMIAGTGLPMDAVVTDFQSGAAELLSPDNDDDHWDVIEGQGAIFHPGFGQVTFGLLIGSQPDAFVVCHAAGRDRIKGWDQFPTPAIGDVIERTIDIGRLTNPGIRCVGISIDTSSLDTAEQDDYAASIQMRYALPCVDPLKHGTQAIIDRINSETWS